MEYHKQTFAEKKNPNAKSSHAAEELSMDCSPGVYDAAIIPLQVISHLLTNSEWTSVSKAQRVSWELVSILGFISII